MHRRARKRRSTIGVAVCVSLACLCAATAPGLPQRAAAADAALELTGWWYLTIHYRDEASGDPEALRWEDCVWRFARRGTRMQWTEFPVVVFEDESGRFETTGDGRPARTLRWWEPNEAQLAEIERGVHVDVRGSRSKSLRGDEASGYRSAGGLQSESTGVIGYSESWSVEGLPGRPVFTQDVAMGSGRTESVEGRTRYAAETVSADGRLVRGSFERDGTRHGTFVLRRAGAAEVVGGRKDARP